MPPPRSLALRDGGEQPAPGDERSERRQFLLPAGYGVMSTPALVIDEQVVVASRVPYLAAVRELLASHAARPRAALPAQVSILTESK